jgi:hypothetical protein
LNMSKINSFLRKHGYRPELSTDFSKFVKVINGYLGIEKAKQLFDLMDWSTEEKVHEFIGNDTKLLKLVFGFQINISGKALENLIEVIETIGINPNGILDLGGADGWASKYMREYFNWSCGIKVVDANKYWGSIDSTIESDNSFYKDFASSKKYDLVISIFGAPMASVDDLIECAFRNINDQGLFVAMLRVASENEFLKLIERADAIGFNVLTDHSSKISVAEQAFPLISFNKKVIDKALTNGDKIGITRKAFHNYAEQKRIIGIEAKCFYEIVKDGKLISHEEKIYDNAVASLKCIEFNGINYRIWIGADGGFILEYPITENDLGATIDDLNIRFFEERKFYSNSL